MEVPDWRSIALHQVLRGGGPVHLSEGDEQHRSPAASHCTALHGRQKEKQRVQQSNCAARGGETMMLRGARPYCTPGDLRFAGPQDSPPGGAGPGMVHTDSTRGAALPWPQGDQANPHPALPSAPDTLECAPRNLSNLGKLPLRSDGAASVHRRCFIGT